MSTKNEKERRKSDFGMIMRNAKFSKIERYIPETRDKMDDKLCSNSSRFYLPFYFPCDDTGKTIIETGETRDMEPSYSFFNNCRINAIALITCVTSNVNPKTDGREVQIKCWALDCLGEVFQMELYFLPDSLEQEKKIFLDLPEGKILVVSGQYTFMQKECNISLCDVLYWPLPPEIAREEVEEAFRFYSVCVVNGIKKAAEQGDIAAQIELGYMYWSGNGVPQDQSEAEKWLRMAAEQGDAETQFNLGSMYDEGIGVKQDYNEALKWYLKAAEQGHEEAQFNLEQIYSNGEGVQQVF